MHNSMVTTETIYSKLANDDVHDVITSLGTKRKNATPDAPMDVEKLTRLLQIVYENPSILDDLLDIL